MTATQAAAEYLRLAVLAEPTVWGSDEWKAAIGFAWRFENDTTEEAFDEYLNIIERDYVSSVVL